MGEELCALLIDDDDLIQETLSRQLAREGITVTRAVGDAAGARAALRHGPRVDLIVLDLLLSGIDAVELLRETAAQHAGSALILVSSQERSVLRSVAILAAEQGLHVLGALRKPIRTEALQDLLAPWRLARRQPTPTGPATREGEVLAQPLFRTGDGGLHGMEILAGPRDGRAVSEASAEDRLLALVCRSGAEWWRAGLPLRVTVNLGDASLGRLDLPERVARQLTAHGLMPEMLCIQVGETARLEDPPSLDVLTRLRLRGVRIALDRFGAGLGAVMRLQRLPIAEVRIAPRLVRGLGDEGPAALVLGPLLQMATGLSLDTVATGVDQPGMAETLTRMGCGVLQGNQLEAPMPLSEVTDWARRRTPRVAASVAA